MTSSGSIDFNRTRNQIIKSALRKIGAIAANETPDAGMVDDAAEALNAVTKELQVTGIHLWTVAEARLWLQPDQAAYSLSSTSTDHATLSSDVIETALAADAASGATSLTVDSITGIADNDYIGIVVDDGTTHWTQFNGTPSGTTIVIDTGLDDSAATDNYVFTYTTKLQRPLRVVHARPIHRSSSLETAMIPLLSRLDYRSLPNKTSSGVPTQFYYDPQLGNGKLHVWPVASDSESAVNFTFYRPIEDFDAQGDTPDLPQEWISTLIYLLAVELCPEYDVAPPRYTMLKSEAAEKFDRVTGWDQINKRADPFLRQVG